MVGLYHAVIGKGMKQHLSLITDFCTEISRQSCISNGESTSNSNIIHAVHCDQISHLQSDPREPDVM
jgi:hypothetical protein